jgi:hypothetical protein
VVLNPRGVSAQPLRHLGHGVVEVERIEHPFGHRFAVEPNLAGRNLLAWSVGLPQVPYPGRQGVAQVVTHLGRADVVRQARLGRTGADSVAGPGLPGDRVVEIGDQLGQLGEVAVEPAETDAADGAIGRWAGWHRA